MAQSRNPLAKALTFARFAVQQRGAARRIAAELPPAGEGMVRLNGGEQDWVPTGFMARAGETFQVSATGALWMSKALSVGFEPRLAVWVRIGGAGPIRKLLANTCVFTAWADGPVQVIAKTLIEWADESGALMNQPERAMPGGIAINVNATTDAADEASSVAAWRYLWRLGDGRIYRQEGEEIAVSTYADVGILQREVDVALTAETRLSWSWLIEALPSALPEDLAPTHDYLSIAVEFENGRDLTYMWSAGLKPGHVFHCPLPFWCDRETHWVLRSGAQGLGRWRDESRAIAADYDTAIGGERPQKVVRVWLIANSVFQRRAGKARFKGIQVG